MIRKLSYRFAMALRTAFPTDSMQKLAKTGVIGIPVRITWRLHGKLVGGAIKLFASEVILHNKAAFKWGER